MPCFLWDVLDLYANRNAVVQSLMLQWRRLGAESCSEWLTTVDNNAVLEDTQYRRRLASMVSTCRDWLNGMTFFESAAVGQQMEFRMKNFTKFEPPDTMVFVLAIGWISSQPKTTRLAAFAISSAKAGRFRTGTG